VMPCTKRSRVPPERHTEQTRLWTHSELERIARAALEVGRLLMETGARAEIVHEDSSLGVV
jgi:hypothetical protein